MLGAAVEDGDVVVLHDAVAAVTAEAARDRGAHVFWRIDAATSPAPRSAVAAWEFMRPRSHGVDGYVGAWGAPGAGRERIGAALPSTGAVTARDVGSTHVPAGWSGALADLVVRRPPGDRRRDGARAPHSGGAMMAARLQRRRHRAER